MFLGVTAETIPTQKTARALQASYQSGLVNNYTCLNHCGISVIQERVRVVDNRVAPNSIPKTAGNLHFFNSLRYLQPNDIGETFREVFELSLADLVTRKGGKRNSVASKYFFGL